jgi:HSP20 family protein
MAKKESRELVKTEPTARFPVSWDMEKWFEDFFRRPFPSMMARPWTIEEMEFSPAIDIYEEENDVVVKAELPGMKKEDLDISLSEDAITIAGEKKSEHKTERKGFYRHESSYGSFCRTMALPVDVQTDKVKADFKDGILEIRLPKTEEAKKKEVKIKIE